MGTRLINANDYFLNVTEPAYRQFKNGEVTFLVVFSMVAGLYHQSDWLWYHDSEKLRKKFGEDISSGYRLWKKVEESVQDAGFIRDLNNAAKHVVLSLKNSPSTGMHHAANTYITITGWGERSYGAGPFGGGPTISMDEGGRQVLLEPIATQVFLFWDKLIHELYRN